MHMKRIIISVLAIGIACISASAQSKDFKLGQWSEIENSIVKELNKWYVDSLPVDRMHRAAIDAMLNELDPYTVYVPEEENEDMEMLINKTYGGIGAVIYKAGREEPLYINEPYAGSPAAKAGLVCGDEILAVDGFLTKGHLAAECTEKMKGKPGTQVVFHVRKVRTGEECDVTVTRERIHLPDVEYAGMLDKETGYILQTGFTDNVSNDIRNAVVDLKKQGMKKLILDLRGNGGGLLNEAVNIVGLFVPKGSVVVTQRGNNDEEVVMKTSNNPVDTEIPIVVLVDSGSASASEIVSGALQDYDRATIMGHRTYGKGLVQSFRKLPYNGSMKLTIAKYYTPSGRCVQALDYSHRNEDGSVGAIPDSLTHEFKTAGGRIVRDGGGITPDVKLQEVNYSRLTYSIVLNGIVEQYALKYAMAHESIPAVDDFHFSDKDYEDFIGFAKTKEFDYRSSARTLFDQMKKELEKDGLKENMKDELAALEKALEMDKETFLRLKKDEVIPFIEEEIVVRYYFQEAGVRIRTRYDAQLQEAMKADLIKL